MHEPAEGRIHRWRLARSYQFPAATQFINDTSVQPLLRGWIVNVVHTKPI